MCAKGNPNYCSPGSGIRDCSNYPGLEKGYFRVAVKLHEQNEKLIQVLNEVLG